MVAPRAGGVLHTAATGVAVVQLTAAAWLVWWMLVAVVVPGWAPVVIASGSMGPLIRPGDLVVTAPAPRSLLTEGAVIVYRDDVHGLVTHRITAVADDGSLRTKGDANQSEDTAPVAPEDVVGRGRLLVPAIGRPLLWIHGQRWLPLGATVSVTLLSWWLVSGWWRRTGPSTEPDLSLIAFAWVERP